MKGGYSHNCVIGTLESVENQLQCWGEPTNGKTNIPLLSNPHSLTVNDYITCVIDDFSPRCWGAEPDDIANWLGGPLNYSDRLYIPWLSYVSVIFPGYQSLCALSQSGVNCWGGGNQYHELEVPSLVNPTQLVSGDTFRCVVDDNGLQCWGTQWGREFNVPPPILSDPTSLTVIPHINFKIHMAKKQPT